MGCGGSKDQDKKENDKKKNEEKKSEEKKSEEKKSEKQAQEAGSPEQGEQPVEPSAAAQEGQEAVDREVAGGARAGQDVSVDMESVNSDEEVVQRGQPGAAPAAGGAAAVAEERNEEEPEVTVLKRRPQRSAPASGTPRATHPQGEAKGNYEDYAPRDEDGQLIVRPEEQEMAGNGQLIEREEPQWHVARPPPATSGWVLLRQVRMVMQMRNLTAI
ncbi:hypothetical protein AGDE_13943 [Angomonas deanei]|nr:hypothetical protein AGDE_13943 [Angomonas deanei]|eukprot:EPY21584.1 hypothetical protein AGDE_13943 [Angomonas deanei]